MSIRGFYKRRIRQSRTHYVYWQGQKFRRGERVWCYMRRLDTGEIEWEGWVRV